MALIELRNLSKIYDLGEVQVAALKGVSIEIHQGEFVALIGPSGSGKSTLMNTVGCLDRPTTGSYLLAGEEVAGLNPDQLARVRNRQIGFVFQNFNLLSRTTALENVEVPLLYNSSCPRRQRKRRASPLEMPAASEPRTWFTPADDPSGGQWFTRDPQAIAAAMKLDRVAPFTIDADAGADRAALPEGGETILAFPNNHLSYALTWFGMAIALAGVFAGFAWKRRQELLAAENAPSGDEGK